MTAWTGILPKAKLNARLQTMILAMKRVIFCLTLWLSAACSPSADAPTAAADNEPQTASREAAVAIPDHYAAAVAEKILRAGGNAVDAAVATGFALAVTYVDAGNIGGGGFMMIHVDGESSFLDYREKAPLAAHRDMYLDENGEVIDQGTCPEAGSGCISCIVQKQDQ